MIMNTILAWAPGGMQVILILAIVLILFGAKKIPELAKGLGHGIKEFKKATKEVTDEINNPAPTEMATTVTPAQKLPPANTTAQSQPPETKVI
jgi:sec-independent protein translocase protein TatA